LKEDVRTPNEKGFDMVLVDSHNNPIRPDPTHHLSLQDGTGMMISLADGQCVVTELFGDGKVLQKNLAPHFAVIRRALRSKKQRANYLPDAPPAVVALLLSKSPKQKLGFFCNLWMVTKLRVVPVGEYRYTPQEDSPIRLALLLPNGEEVTVYEGFTKKVYKVRRLKPGE
jgi:hypothetical protein